MPAGGASGGGCGKRGRSRRGDAWKRGHWAAISRGLAPLPKGLRLGVAAKAGWPERPIAASVVPCQLPMKEMIRRLPVARRLRRCATSLASEPEKPN